MPSSEEESRKKRQVHPIEEETPKKVRVNHHDDTTSANKISNSKSMATVKNNTFAAHKVPPHTPNVASKPTSTDASANNPERSAAATGPPPSFDMAKGRSLWTAKNRRVWDLEGALLYLVQEPTAMDGDQNKEYLTHDQSAWVTFRLGHAGDASTIANWYRLAKHQVMDTDTDTSSNASTDTIGLEETLENEDELNQVENELNQETARGADRLTDRQPAPSCDDDADDGAEGTTAMNRSANGNGTNNSNSTSMLEVWLADGFGDDRTLPFVYSLVADVHQRSSASTPPNVPLVASTLPTASNEEASSRSSHKEPNEKTQSLPSADEVSSSEDLKQAAVSKQLGAVALLTTGLDEKDFEKILRIEWLGLNPDLSTDILVVLRQRLWLRLSTVSVMTACQGGIEWEDRLSLDPLRQQEQVQEQERVQVQQPQEQQEATARNNKKTKKMAQVENPIDASGVDNKSAPCVSPRAD